MPRDGEGEAIRVVRPLKDMGMKECAAWAWWNSLDMVGEEGLVNGKQAVGGLTKGTFPPDCRF